MSIKKMDENHMVALKERIKSCTLCAADFAQTATAHAPKPIVWFEQSAKILVAGQAPGALVYSSGIPFDDPSGERLRDWMGISKPTFYDTSQLAIIPMAFCFPGYDNNGSDLPPPPICSKKWHKEVLNFVTPKLTLLVGSYAQKYQLGLAQKISMSETVKDWRAHAPHVFPLPHPSWRNTGWLRKNTWFEAELLPALKLQVQKVLRDD